jgi:hypothetical protein
MCLPTKSGLSMAAILAASVGFAGLTEAAPLAGVAAAIPAVHITQVPSVAEALPDKAYHRGINIIENPMSIENRPVTATTTTSSTPCDTILLT